jgi:hypothetical protein
MASCEALTRGLKITSVPVELTCINCASRTLLVFTYSQEISTRMARVITIPLTLGPSSIAGNIRMPVSPEGDCPHISAEAATVSAPVDEIANVSKK